jgi:glutathione peroxidase
MKLPATLCTLALAALAGCAYADDKPAAKGKKMASPLDYKMKDIEGKEVDLSQYKGKVVLLVNVASECGYTPQYKGLEELYEKFKGQGFIVIGIPSNEFGHQEPGTNADILKFCQNNYKVTFPMMGKVVVKGDGKVPLYQFLTEKDTNPDHAGEVGWNFEKFLIGKDGKVVGRYKSSVEPMSDGLVGAVKKQLEAK